MSTFDAAGEVSADEIAALMGEVLEVDPIDLHDDFFAVGGNSLLAAVVVGGLRQEKGVRVTVKDIFECPQPAVLAKRLLGRDQEARR